MNVRQNLSVLFYLKRKKITADKKIPIYVRITIDGLRDEFAFGYKVLDTDWDEEVKRIRPTDSHFKAINKKIGQATSDIERHFDWVQAKNGLATPQAVKQSYLSPINGHQQLEERKENFMLSEQLDGLIATYIGYCDKIKIAHKDGRIPCAEKLEVLEEERLTIKKELEILSKKATVIFDNKSRQKTLMMAVDEYLLHFMQMAFTGHRSVNTLEKWTGRKRRYLDFLQYRFKLSDLPLPALEYRLLEDLIKYLLVQHEVSQNTAMKYAQCIKEIMDRTVTLGWVPANIFSIFQCSYTDTDVKWPSLAEVEALIDFPFDKEILNEIRDVAIFQAFTGFSYQETYDVSTQDLFTGIDGHTWVGRNRQKTEVEESVPLLPIPLQLIERYQNHPKCMRSGKLLPVPTNEYYNRCLKEIAEITGSTVLNNTHQWRYFFANEVTYNKGVPLKTVSRMLGHASVKTTEKYVKANKANVAANMEMVKSKLFTKGGRLKTTSNQIAAADGKQSACGLRVVHRQ